MSSADASGSKRRRTFKKFSYRGVDLERLLTVSNERLLEMLPARPRRRFVHRGMQRKELTLLKKLRKSKRECGEHEKPAPVKTHLRNMVIVPEMIGSIVQVYNGITFNTVDVKPEMVGHYLGEFSITYKPVRHGRSGTNVNFDRFIPLH
mmetsp:Transcript_4026/g.9903  ORF Transcript_4026/g.9903 Transcript_4026/m.9903 type:complete len:149 (-) Transcript_4026:97-543(-)|eukprot:CAMPEP_0177642814 /NCGR_PEP_ID=MMETSP0447-20121125/7816_1 /TAXON_ID=0 /ORGANISM="Stygamoeba regulata, Strain BSH-02190019" /LENGTH=148 /DNA_ID=CAMNT_0019145055 /DNA_START=416 /DNA_END=862 /DNA_ORIENTATION=-